MFTENILLRILWLIGVVMVMLSIFGVTLWRGAVFLGISYNLRSIVLLSFGLLALMIAGMSLSFLPWKWVQFMGTLMIWIIYILWILAPLLILLDILGIWYKIPSIVFVVLCLTRIGIGLYFGNITKTTQLSLSGTKLSKKIVFISDLHVEAIHGKRYVQKIVDQIKEKKPDLVLIWWDLMNTAKSEFVDDFTPFNQLDIPVYATLGNHDNMWNKDSVLNIFKRTKILPLRNQSINLSGLQIVGIDDKSYREGKTLDAILKTSQIQTGAKYTILISHQPQKLSKLAQYPIDLELAGHTHQGQFIPLSWVIGRFNDYAYGRYDENGKTAFVSQGIGTWWAPIRIGTQSEMVEIILKP